MQFVEHTQHLSTDFNALIARDHHSMVDHDEGTYMTARTDTSVEKKRDKFHVAMSAGRRAVDARHKNDEGGSTIVVLSKSTNGITKNIDCSGV